MWFDPPDNLILPDDEVHIWRADLDIGESFQSSFLKLLSSDEKYRANKFRFNEDSRRFITARGILRLLLGKYLEINPAEITFHYGEFGKPNIENHNSLQFNISHSQNVALFALTKERNIGVDVEFVNPNIEAQEIAARFFANNEVKNLLALPEKDQILGFFNCWTRKEAFIKAVGEGLSFPLDKFEVSLEPTKPAKLLATHWKSEEVFKWSIYALPPEPNFVGSVVIEGFVDKLRCWTWSNANNIFSQ